MIPAMEVDFSFRFLSVSISNSSELSDSMIKTWTQKFTVNIESWKFWPLENTAGEEYSRKKWFSDGLQKFICTCTFGYSAFTHLEGMELKLIIEMSP